MKPTVEPLPQIIALWFRPSTGALAVIHRPFRGGGAAPCDHPEAATLDGRVYTHAEDGGPLCPCGWRFLCVFSDWPHAHLVGDARVCVLPDGIGRILAALHRSNEDDNYTTRLREAVVYAGRSLVGPSASAKEAISAVAAHTKDEMKTSVDVQMTRKDGQIASVVDADTGESVPYLQRLIDGQCPRCGQEHGYGPNERYLLPRVERGDSWDFVAPCGHAVLGIKKNSPLAEEYGLSADVGVLSKVEQDLLKTALVCEYRHVKAEHLVPAARLVSLGLVTARDSYGGVVLLSPTKAGQGLARGLGLHIYRGNLVSDPGWFHHHPDPKERAT